VLKFNPGGYDGAKMDGSFGAPLPSHYSCRCGYYLDADAPPVVAFDPGMKIGATMPCKQINGSEVVGLVKAVVTKRFREIESLRKDRISWEHVTKHIQVYCPDVPLDTQAVVNCYWRIKIKKSNGKAKQPCKK
jgi:hypothetical protein